MRAEHDIIVVGAGLTGAMLAILLARRGHRVTIFEKRGKIAQSQPDTKRTIAMSISRRGWKALEAVDLAERLRELSTPTYGRVTHHPSGARYKQYYGQEHQAIDTIDRKVLNCALIDRATELGCEIHYDAEVEQLDLAAKTIALNCEGNTRLHRYASGLFAADGVFSRCRREYERAMSLPAQMTKLLIGYKEFTLPYAMVQDMDLDRSFVQVWPGGAANFVALPSNTKQAFLGNLFCPNEWIEFFGRSPSKRAILDLMVPHFPGLEALLERLDDASFTEPSANIYTTSSECWNHDDSFLMLGDAVHGMAPFYAMGMNTCLEDCHEFNVLLGANAGDLAPTIAGFQQHRKRDVDAMQRISLENFQNLSTSSEAWFEQEWRLDRLLSEHCPDQWLTECALVSFHDMPVAEIGPWVARQKQFVAAEGLTPEVVERMSAAQLEQLRSRIEQLACAR